MELGTDVAPVIETSAPVVDTAITTDAPVVESVAETPVVDNNVITKEDWKNIAPSLRNRTQNTPEPEVTTEPETKTEPETVVEKPVEDTPAVTKFKLPDGEELTLEQIQELKKGSMLQADYTRKTQEIAEERKKFQPYKDKPIDEAMALWERLSSDPIGTVRFLEEHYAAEGITEPKDPAVLKVEMELAKKEAELAAKNQTLDEQETAQRKANFDSYMNGLVEKYKNYELDTAAVVKYCLDNAITNPELGFKALAADKLEAENKSLKEQINNKATTAVSEYVKEKIVKSDTFTAPVGSGNSGTGVSVKKPKTFAEARRSALSKL